MTAGLGAAGALLVFGLALDSKAKRRSLPRLQALTNEIVITRLNMIPARIGIFVFLLGMNHISYKTFLTGFQDCHDFHDVLLNATAKKCKTMLSTSPALCDNRRHEVFASIVPDSTIVLHRPRERAGAPVTHQNA